jgi:hypothetical protein
VIFNGGDTLYFEKATGINSDVCTNVDGSYAHNTDYQMAVGCGVLFNHSYFYGLAERESGLLLSSTLDSDPYRMFNVDFYAHGAGDPRG